MSDQKLKPGDVVEVRSPAEILSTLDGEASIDGMPFMAEMLQYAGKRFTVSHRVEKICDTVSGEAPNSRRMRDTALLDDLRCDGSAHGGCQAGCRIYWKDSWLRPVDQVVAPPTRAGEALAELEALAAIGGRATGAADGLETDLYRCQATEALRASEPLSAWDARQYIREITSRNVDLVRAVRVAARALRALFGRRLHGVRRRLGLLGEQPSQDGARPVSALVPLNLQPGELVEVRTPEEIAATLNGNGKYRGLWYDKDEMEPFAGGRYRVRDRVERIIDERTGEMIHISSDCLILDGVACSGDNSTCRWFCPRGIYPYWREAWLGRVEDGDPASPIIPNRRSRK